MFPSIENRFRLLNGRCLGVSRGILCLFYVLFWGVCADGSLDRGWVRSVGIFLVVDWRMGAFIRSIILEGVAVNDFTTGVGTKRCCLTVGEDGTEEEGAIFLAVC